MLRAQVLSREVQILLLHALPGSLVWSCSLQRTVVISAIWQMKLISSCVLSCRHEGLFRYCGGRLAHNAALRA